MEANTVLMFKAFQVFVDKVDRTIRPQFSGSLVSMPSVANSLRCDVRRAIRLAAGEQHISGHFQTDEYWNEF